MTESLTLDHENIGQLAATSDLLSVSIVTYRPDMRLLNRTLNSLGRAMAAAHAVRGEPLPAMIALVDNDDRLRAQVLNSGSELVPEGGAGTLAPQIITGHGNVGYGRGHNLALAGHTGRYHLILNPDVELSADALDIALRFMDSHTEVGLLAPRIADDHDKLQYLCRRYPTVFDLFARGFLPQSVRAVFAARLARYEMRDLVDRTESGRIAGDYLEPSIISGCFMLFRTAVLKQIGGFDSRYFLYFEDYDLSLRAGAVARIAYVPAVRIVHFGGGASRKGWLHIKLFASSAYKFFSRFGWRWV